MESLLDLFPTIIGGIAYYLTLFVGQLLLLVVRILISTASYNEFVSNPVVTNGWIITRDVTNMFFIVILLVLAFGTLLSIEKYNYKKFLPKLLITAIVINFSRTICGLMIDFGQVVMLTFVNGFKEAAGGNFVDAFRINSYLSANPDAAAVNAWSAAMAACLGFIMASISLGVVIIITITLIVRIIYLWILVVLSPLAFFMNAVPFGKASGYYGRWWDMFSKNVITGPVLAFFLWLALMSVASGGTSLGTVGGDAELVNEQASPAFDVNEIQSFMVAIVLLLIGIQAGAEAGGAGAGIGKKYADMAKGYVTKKADQLGRAAAKKTALGGANLLTTPFRPKDEQTGKRVRAEDLAVAKFGQLKTSRVGRAFGMDEDYKKQQQTERQIAAFAATGQKGKADDLRKKHLEQLATKERDAGFTGAKLDEEVKKVGATEKGSYRHKALLLAQAQDKGSRFKDRPQEMVAAVAAASGKDGDAQLLKLMRESREKAGDQFSDIEATKDADIRGEVKKKMSDMNEGQLNTLFRDIGKDVSKGVDGKMNSDFGTAKLLALDDKMFDKRSGAVQEEIEKAFVTAVANTDDVEKQKELEDHFEKISGKRFDTKYGAKALMDMEKKQFEKATVEEKGKIEEAFLRAIVKDPGKQTEMAERFKRLSGRDLNEDDVVGSTGKTRVDLAGEAMIVDRNKRLTDARGKSDADFQKEQEKTLKAEGGYKKAFLNLDEKTGSFTDDIEQRAFAEQLAKTSDPKKIITQLDAKLLEGEDGLSDVALASAASLIRTRTTGKTRPDGTLETEEYVDTDQVTELLRNKKDAHAFALLDTAEKVRGMDDTERGAEIQRRGKQFADAYEVDTVHKAKVDQERARLAADAKLTENDRKKALADFEKTLPKPLPQGEIDKKTEAYKKQLAAFFASVEKVGDELKKQLEGGTALSSARFNRTYKVRAAKWTGSAIADTTREFATGVGAPAAAVALGGFGAPAIGFNLASAIGTTGAAINAFAAQQALKSVASRVSDGAKAVKEKGVGGAIKERSGTIGAGVGGAIGAGLGGAVGAGIGAAAGGAVGYGMGEGGGRVLKRLKRI